MILGAATALIWRLLSYFMDPSTDNKLEILTKALETGVLLYLFEYALPRVISSFEDKFNTEKFKDFVRTKWKEEVKFDFGDAKVSLEIINSYGDDALKMIKSSQTGDIVKQVFEGLQENNIS